MVSLRGKWPLPVALIVLGASLRIGVFLVNRSFSIDEAALSRILIDSSWRDLIGPLDYAQVEPPGFLFVQKINLSLFGNHETTFRLFPLLCGVGSLWLLWAVSKRVLSFRSSVIALTLFAVAPGLIDYSSRAKQYSTEVAAAILVLFVAVDLCQGAASTKRAFWLGAVGASMAAFSFSVAFVLVAAAITCAFVAATREEGRRRPLTLAALLLAAGATGGVLVGHFSMTPTDASYMNWFWEAGFMPFSSGWLYAISWLWHRLLAVFSFTAQYRAPIGWLGLCGLGIWSLSRRGLRPLALVLVLPLLLTMSAAVLHQYPFQWGRVELFLLPSVMILVAEGTEWCWRLYDGRGRWLCAVPAGLVLVLGGYSALGNRAHFEDNGVKPVLEEIKSKWRPADHLYVYHGDVQQFLYYQDRFSFRPEDYTVGACSRGSDRRYLHEIDGLRGRQRVWMLLTRDDAEAAVFTKYLDAVGIRTGNVRVKKSDDPDYWNTTFAYLYDLSGSPDSASVSAGHFELPEGLDRDSPFIWACYGVFSPFVRNSH